MILTVCLAVLGMLSVKAQQSIIALHHQGNVTIFAGAKTQEAMDASVKGDTLYLSEGTFAGFNVTHGIVVLGSGEKTVVSGNITITGNDEKKDLGGYVFSGLNMLQDFVVNDSVNGLRLGQCQMTNFAVNEGMFLDSGVIMLSFIKGTLLLQSSIYGLDIISSKIVDVKYGGNTSGAVSLTHCNIGRETHLDPSYDNDYAKHPNTHNNIYNNCIVGEVRYSTFVNSIYNFGQAEYYGMHSGEYFFATLRDSKQINFTFDGNMNCSLTDEELKTAGFLGNDGTVVGITGGDVPYTLELAAPHVVDHKVEVDNVNRKMTVTLKMAHDANKKEEE